MDGAEFAELQIPAAELLKSLPTLLGLDITPEQIIGVLFVFTGICLCLFATRALRFFVGLSGFAVTFVLSYGVLLNVFKQSGLDDQTSLIGCAVVSSILGIIIGAYLVRVLFSFVEFCIVSLAFYFGREISASLVKFLIGHGLKTDAHAMVPAVGVAEGLDADAGVMVFVGTVGFIALLLINIHWSLAVSAILGVIFVVVNHEALAYEALGGVQQFVSISMVPVALPRVYSFSIIAISVVVLLVLFRGKRFLALMATIIGASLTGLGTELLVHPNLVFTAFLENIAKLQATSLYSAVISVVFFFGGLIFQSRAQKSRAPRVRKSDEYDYEYDRVGAEQRLQYAG